MNPNIYYSILWLMALPAMIFPFRDSSFHYYKSLTVNDSNVNFEFISFKLDDQIMAHSGRNDLRLMTLEKEEIPFLRKSVYETKGTYGNVKPRVIFSQTSQSHHTWVIRLPVLENASQYTELLLDSEENIEASLEVSYSKDSATWFGISTNKVFKYKNRKKMKIDFKEKEFRYIRIKSKKELRLVFLKANFAPAKELKALEKKLKKDEFSCKNNIDSKETICRFENKTRANFNKIVLKTSKAAFSRYIRIYTFQENEKSLHKILGRRIENIKEKPAEIPLTFRANNDPFFKIVIENNHNAPLVIEDITLFSNQEEIIFRNLGKKKYLVFYGNRYAKAANYDIEKTFENGSKILEGTLGLEKKNENFSYSFSEPPLSVWVIRFLFFIGAIGIMAYAYRNYTLEKESSRL